MSEKRPDQSQTPSNKSQSLPALLRNPEFLLGAAQPSQFPNDDIVEIAFAGRSNVGKSSAINAITNRRKLARTSKQPGRTQEINFFSMGPNARLVDLPGYGFAQVPLAVKKKWQQTIHSYLSNRPNLVVLVLLMDIRHPLTELDQQMLNWARDSELPTQILLTKADKFKRGKIASSVLKVEKTLEQLNGQFGVEPFSSQNYTGVQEMRLQLENWVNSTINEYEEKES
ncbi:MAG: ribosome biogenesis GTP-binding protein YihA/YsxC [Acidiferrobacterales bacterium]|nr:ribosome biogenesis GTP-binding protein YihA/YsxC [Acidiferrobacterales bacterium]